MLQCALIHFYFLSVVLIHFKNILYPEKNAMYIRIPNTAYLKLWQLLPKKLLYVYECKEKINWVTKYKMK